MTPPFTDKLRPEACSSRHSRYDAGMIESPEDLHVKFQEAFNRHDLDAIVALYEPRAVLVRGDGLAEGIDAIREAYRQSLGAHTTIDLQTLRTVRCAELVMLHGKWVVQERGADGQQIRREGRNTETARLQADGRWLFVIDNPSVPRD
jgi:uncharacterized protein (TIGR02246 family)